MSNINSNQTLGTGRNQFGENYSQTSSSETIGLIEIMLPSSRGNDTIPDTPLSKEVNGPVVADAQQMVDRVYRALETILLVYELYGFKDKDFTIYSSAIHWRLLVRDSNGEWMKVFKYKLAAFFAYWTDSEKPVKPFKTLKDRPGVLLGGKADKWVGNFLRHSTKKMFFSFLQTILLSKNGMPRPKEIEMIEQTKKTMKILTEERRDNDDSQLSWADLTDLYMDKEKIQEQIRRTVKEIFHGQTYTWEDRTKVFCPSTSANYINNREGAGAIGSILDSGLVADLREPGGTLSHHLNRSEEEERGKGNYEVTIGTSRLEETFSILYARILKRAMMEPADVKLVALSESLKVRIISKGPPMTYTALKPLQKKMHTILRNHKVFQLIGAEVTELSLLNGLFAKLNEDETFISVDYQAATDNIAYWASEEACCEIAEELNLSEAESELLIRALTRHTIEGKPQTGGQLMGSIVSFPILCIINAAICRYAMELGEGRTIKLIDCALLINGDDAVMKTKDKTYDIWKRLATATGLTPSVGKVFKSREYLNINSRFFLYEKEMHEIKGDRAERRPCPYRSVRHVNIGLMYGNKRSQGKVGLADQEDPRNNIGVRAHELIETCPDELQDEVMRHFINRHRKLLESTRLPWFLPQWIGGLGLPPFGVIKTPTGDPDFPYKIDYKYKNSKLDLRMANTILSRWQIERPIPLGIAKQPWHLRDTAAKVLPEPEYAEHETPDTREYEHTLNQKIVDLLFDSNISMPDIYDKFADNSKRIVKAIKHNARLYSPTEVIEEIVNDKIVKKVVQKHIMDPIDASRLTYRRLFPYLPIKKKERPPQGTKEPEPQRIATETSIPEIPKREQIEPERTKVLDLTSYPKPELPANWHPQVRAVRDITEHIKEKQSKIGRRQRRAITLGGRLSLDDGIIETHLERNMGNR